MKLRIYILFLSVIMPLRCFSQEEDSAIKYGNRYLEINFQKLSKYNLRRRKQQERLLKRLCRNEKALNRKLIAQDSMAYIELFTVPSSYDSIRRISKPDNSALIKRHRRSNGDIDSLKIVQLFVNEQYSSLYGIVPSATAQSDKLNEIQDELNYRNYIDDLINERSKNIKNSSNNSRVKSNSFKAIDKNIYYSKQRIKSIKELANKPSKAERKALEYLQGCEGFDRHIDKIGPGPRSIKGLSNSVSLAELEKRGLQTKQQMQNALKERFGNNIGGVTQKMSSQLKDFQKQGKEFSNALKEAKENINDTKRAVRQLHSLDKPSFKINSMRGKLLWQRIEKQYTWQTMRATAERPALMEVSSMIGFRHTTTLTYGLGLAMSMGLGKGWEKVKISFEGLGFRSYLEWKWQYGVCAYAGYETMFKIAAFRGNEIIEPNISSKHDNGTCAESVLIGVSKSYHINSKYNGAIQLLYDVWGKEKGVRSPIVLRFSTQTK